MAGVPSGTGRSERILPPLPYESADAAQSAAEQLVERRKKRGYVKADRQPAEGVTNHDDHGATFG
jgi:predicted DNA-binding WGR domain protein